MPTEPITLLIWVLIILLLIGGCVYILRRLF